MHVRKLKPNQQIRSVYVYYEYDNWSRYGINKKYMQENEFPPLHMKYPETRII